MKTPSNLLLHLAVYIATFLSCIQITTSTAHTGQLVEWYDGERAPSLFRGFLTITKNGYLFTEINPTETISTNHIVKFYDEDAEAEAIKIAKENMEKPINIVLLGYPDKEGKSYKTIEVIYGLDPNKQMVD